jgi:exopolysaccharide biosynthesis protein
MRRLFWPLLLVFAVVFASHQWRAQGRDSWKTIAPGVEMRRLDAFEHGLRVPVVAFRVTPERVHIVEGPLKQAAQWRQTHNALLAVNGGFFGADEKALGLRVCDGVQTTPLHGTRWGVFRIKNGVAAVRAAGEVRDAIKRGVRYQQAVQCGPVLVKNRRIQSFKTQWARRTGLGVQDNGRVVIAVADGQMLFETWAQLWASRDGLNCADALNLDGGSSTQLSLRSGKNTLHIPSGRSVPDVVLIK